MSPASAAPRVRALEAQYAYSWFKNITADMFT
ncbi:MAG: FCSD flavin-binding domain-containing protein [Comamonadaceae bacterium]|nr:FCSD flavin-binding domain-containing protein [Comamonadaceae bacterium]